MLELILAQAQNNTMTDEEAAAAAAAAVGGLLFAILVMLAISFLIAIVICFFVYKLQKDVPAEHQKMSPGMVWLLLIPLFNLVWNFIVYRRIPESYQSWSASQGRNDGDCGQAVGLWYAICAACSIVPCVNYIAGPAALVLFIIFLVKMYGLKGQLMSGSPGPSSPQAI